MIVYGVGKCFCRRKFFLSMVRIFGNCSSFISFFMFLSLEFFLLKVMLGIFLLRILNLEVLGIGGYFVY